MIDRFTQFATSVADTYTAEKRCKDHTFQSTLHSDEKSSMTGLGLRQKKRHDEYNMLHIAGTAPARKEEEQGR
jgi:hypothetical protein